MSDISELFDNILSRSPEELLGMTCNGQLKPTVVIVEQPQSQGFRFRYKSETGSHGGIQGESSSKKHKTFPKIKIENCSSYPVKVQAMLYTNESKPRLHVHKLMGPDCDNGTWQKTFDAPVRQQEHIALQGFSILHASKKDIVSILYEREKEDKKISKTLLGAQRILPSDVVLSKEEDDHIKKLAESKAKEFNDHLNSVTLGFTAECNGIRGPICFSSPIFDCKSPSTCKLKICRIDHSSGSCEGGQEIFLLCEKVQKENIEVIFFEKSGDEISWSSKGTFGLHDVHKQFAIVFKTPAYERTDIEREVEVFLQLVRPSDKATSEPLHYTYTPKEDDYDQVQRKKRKKLPGIDDNCSYFLSNYASTSTMYDDAAASAQMSYVLPEHIGSLISRDASLSEDTGLCKDDSLLEDMDIISNSNLEFMEPLYGTVQFESFKSYVNNQNNQNYNNIKHLDISNDEENSIPAVHEHEMEDLKLFESLSTKSPLENFLATLDQTDSGNVEKKQINTFDLENKTFDNKPALMKMEYRSNQLVCWKDFRSSFEMIITQFLSIMKIDKFIPAIAEINSRYFKSLKKLIFDQKSESKKELSNYEKENINQRSFKHCTFIPTTNTQMKKDIPVFSSVALPGDGKYEKIAAHNIALLYKNIKDGYPTHKKIITDSSQNKKDMAIKVTERIAEALSNFAFTGELHPLILVMRHLVAIQDEAGDNILCQAVLQEKVNVVKELLKVLETISSCNIINQKNNLLQTVLHAAVFTHQPEVLKDLLVNGADATIIDHHGNNPLHLASHLGDADSLNILLDLENYPINLRPNLDSLNYDGFAPLHLAVQANSLPCVKILTLHGASSDVQDGTSGRTPLHHAVELNCKEIINHLVIENRADVNAKMYNYNTPLHIAYGRGYDSITTNLLASGADAMIENLECLDSSSDEECFDSTNSSEKPCHTAYHMDPSLFVRLHHQAQHKKDEEDSTLTQLIPSFKEHCYISPTKHSSFYPRSFPELEKSKGDLHTLPYGVKVKLSQLLDQESSDEKNWTCLAKTLDLSDFIKELSKSKYSPTRTILDHYEALEGTLASLAEALLKIERYDALKVLTDSMKEHH